MHYLHATPYERRIQNYGYVNAPGLGLEVKSPMKLPSYGVAIAVVSYHTRPTGGGCLSYEVTVSSMAYCRLHTETAPAVGRLSLLCSEGKCFVIYIACLESPELTIPLSQR